MLFLLGIPPAVILNQRCSNGAVGNLLLQRGDETQCNPTSDSSACLLWYLPASCDMNSRNRTTSAHFFGGC